jgi:integrase
MGYRAGDNPAQWRAHLENLLPEKGKIRRVRHHPALPFAEINEIIARLRRQEGVAARALELTILTAVRTNDALGARWDEIDFDAQTWTIPAARMKAEREHRVPLTQPALDILKGMHELRRGPFVFPGQKANKPLSNMSMLMLLRRMGRGDLSVHGFRSSFRDWVSETTSFPREVAEQALAHTVGSAVEQAYRRGDLFKKRRQLMDAWARHCNGEVADNVVDLERKRQ